MRGCAPKGWRGVLATGAIASFASGGCGGLQAGPPSPLGNHERAVTGLASIYSPEQVTVCFQNPISEQRSCRDRIAYALMAGIDLRFGEFEQQFFDHTRYGAFGATLASLGLSGAGGLVGNGTAQILSALATAVTGARESFGRDVMIERTSVALMTAMRAERNTVALRIREGLRRPPELYPLGAALSDLFAYYRAGTIPGALTGVSQAVAVRNQAAQDRLQAQVIAGAARTPSADRLRAYVSEGEGIGQAELVRRVSAIVAAATRAGASAGVTIDEILINSGADWERIRAAVLRAIPGIR